MMTAQSPLKWPSGVRRTARPTRARFDMSLPRAYDYLIWEIERLGGVYPIVTSNRRAYANGNGFISSGREPEDAGVAVYFQLDGKPVVFACDRWDKVADNIRAITKTIEAMRGIARWGVAEAQERAFSGFAELPPPSDEPEWRQVLDLHGRCRREDVLRAFREKAKRAHPDKGGTSAEMQRLIAAREAALREVK